MRRRSIGQRADLTHKHNRDKRRHGWLRLTPAYSLKLVHDILDCCDGRLRVLDPFSGTATTPLAAMERGHDAVGVDINPFLLWLGHVKTARYSRDDQAQAAGALTNAVESLENVEPVRPPPLHKIERWWHADVLELLCSLRAAIQGTARRSSKVRNILDLAFCRTMIAVSNAAFNHQSVSFTEKTAAQAYSREHCLALFRTSTEFIVSCLTPNPSGKGTIVLADSRHLDRQLDGEFDLLLTSPPYPNRMSYIRELRPYMYWLGYLRNARDAGELDWQAIGGTWGIATSRLNDWEPSAPCYEPAYLTRILSDISSTKGKNSELLATYVRKYFLDIWLHILSVKRTLKQGARAIYVVGNSSFYGVLVPVERVYADMLKRAGFINVNIRTIRKRNSKKELFEYAVEGDNMTSCSFYRPRRHAKQLELYCVS